MTLIRIAGPLVLALFGLCWLALSLTGDKAELKQLLSQAELNARQQSAIIEQIDQRNIHAMEVIDHAQRDKADMAARSNVLQRELARLQAGNVCVNEPVPVAVTDRLRERVNAANAAAGFTPAAVAGSVPHPGL